METTVAEPKVISLDGLIGSFELSNRAAGKSPRTIRWYTEILTQFTRYLGREYQSSTLDLFTRDIARSYVLYLQQKPRYSGHPTTPEQGSFLSPRSVQCHVRALKAFSTWLYDEGHTAENRLRNLKLPKAPKCLIQPLKPDEIDLVLGAIDRNRYSGERDYAMVVFMLDSGAREGEVARLRMDRIDLTNGSCLVRGKGDKERIVPIGSFSARVLDNYISQVRPKQEGDGPAYVFLTGDGQPLSENAIKLMFTRLAKKSGVSRLHCHLLRHTFAINYLLNGGDIFSLKEILGHTTLEMVNHYLSFTQAQIKSQHNKFSPMDRLYPGEVATTIKKSVSRQSDIST